MSSKFHAEVEAHQQKLRKTAGIISGVCIALVLVVSAVYWWPESAFTNQDMTVESQDIAPSSLASSAPLVRSQVAQPSNQTRLALQGRLAELDTALQAQRTEPGLQTFGAEALAEFGLTLDKAYAAYAMGEYEQTDLLLSALEIEMPALQLSWQETYQARHEAAIAEYQEALVPDNLHATRNITQARLYNQQTLDLAPNYPAALQLQQQILVLPEMRRAFETLRVAEVENNLSKKIRAAEALLALDSTQSETKQKLQQWRKLATEQEFQRHLQAAVNAFDQGDIAQAQTQLVKAQAIEPNSQAVADLAVQIEAKQAQSSAQTTQQRLTMLAQLDDWPSVQRMAQRALAQYPDDLTAQSYLDLSTQILSGQRDVAQFLSRPERLQDPGIADFAASRIAELTPLLAYSDGLSQQTQTLKSLLAEQTAKVTIYLKSDNRSDLSVQGIGQIGKTRSRTLDLPPGEYIFVAKREGYRTKRQNIVIVQGLDIVVELYCDERI
jgi:hypothetical protein